jgi:hypothetical protein
LLGPLLAPTVNGTDTNHGGDVRATSVLAKTSRDGGACDDDDCPTAYLADDGRLIIQGEPADQTPGVKLGPGEHAVAIPANLARELLRALDR